MRQFGAFRDLQERCGGISPSILNSRVKDLKDADILERSDEGYRLTGQPAIPDVRICYREQDRHRNDSPPRIVIVPRGGDILPPDRAIGSLKDPVTLQAIKHIRLRMFGMQVYCWGSSIAQAEDLVHNALLAFESIGDSGGGTGGADVQFGSEIWESQLDGEGGQKTLGYLISFVATVGIQVTTHPQKLVHVQHVKLTITELDQSQEIDI